jgi:hypothetical protein
MPIPVTITLTSISGTTGPFSLYSCIESTCSGSLTPFVTGVSLSNLQTGSFIPDISGSTPTHVKIKSTGAGCDYEISKPIVGLPTVTPTSTPTATGTSTPTPTPTNTPTATPLPCVISVGFEVDTAGDIRYIDCCGETIYLTFGIGPQVINHCIQNNSLSAVGASISFINYSATSCSCPTTPTPLPATATPQPTPFETTFSGYVSLVNGPTACTGGEYSNVNITVVGTSLCNLTKVKGLSSTMYGNVYGDMTNNTTFWVSDGTDEREFMRDVSAETGTAQTACTACSGAPPTSTPLPPTPTPQTYDVYERCDLTAIYYVDYSAGNLSFVTINSECCSRIDTNKDSAYMATNYSSAIYFSSFTNVTCPCD